jgi:hypothetical protein
MPRWTWHCKKCNTSEDRIVPLRQRDEAYRCAKCGANTERQFAREAALGFMPFEPHYDEGLGCDVTSFGEKKRIMRDLGVHEAGDRKGGAINFDAKAPDKVGKSRPRGEKFVNPDSVKEVPTWVGAQTDGHTNWMKSDQLKTV